MKKTELKQPIITQSMDSKNNEIDVQSEQSVAIETEADGTVWTSIIHDGNELSMNLKNFLSLKLLMHNAANEFAGLENKKRCHLFGAVVFFEPNYESKTIKETGRTGIVAYPVALHSYSETPNPASQMVSGVTEEEVQQKLDELSELTKDPQWLEDLFNCI